MTPKPLNYLAILVTFSLFQTTHVNGQNVFPSSGNVGIGTSSPGNNLQIVHLTSVFGGGSVSNGIPSLQISDNESYASLPTGSTFTNNHKIFDILASQSISHGITISQEAFFVQMNSSIDASGIGQVRSRVGINKTTANSTLDVGGDISSDGNLSINGNEFINSFTNTANSLVIASPSHQLNTEALPALSISGQQLTISNGGSITSTVTLPSASGGDNMGNEVATTSMNMTNHGIYAISTLTAATITSNGDLNAGNNLSVNGSASIGGDLQVAHNAQVGGTVTANGTVLTSDKRFKTNIHALSLITDRLFKVTPCEYKFRTNEFPNRHFDKNEHYGFIAQQVKEIFPNLVSIIDTDGHYGINYTEFIPLLLQALKEENTKINDDENQINELENRITELENKFTNQETSYYQDIKNNIIKSVLYQNTPNPFNIETHIRYQIATKFSTAFIGIYDLNGKQLQKITILPNSTEITVNAGEMAAGMYIYSLIIDGQLIDSKKMILE